MQLYWGRGPGDEAAGECDNPGDTPDQLLVLERTPSRQGHWLGLSKYCQISIDFILFQIGVDVTRICLPEDVIVDWTVEFQDEIPESGIFLAAEFAALNRVLILHRFVKNILTFAGRIVLTLVPSDSVKGYPRELEKDPVGINQPHLVAALKPLACVDVRSPVTRCPSLGIFVNVVNTIGKRML